MTHAATPHAYRIGYVDAAKDWRTDEVVVYDDGYDAANATRIDRVEWPGIYDRDQAWQGRPLPPGAAAAAPRGAQDHRRLRAAGCERGDLVALQHDVIAVGLGSARVDAHTESGTNVLDVTLDDAVTMQTGKTYGLRARRVVSGAHAHRPLPGRHRPRHVAEADVHQPAGDHRRAARRRSLRLRRVRSRDLRLLVRDIEPQQDLSAMLTLIAEAPGVHTAELGPIPPYDPVVTAPLAPAGADRCWASPPTRG